MMLNLIVTTALLFIVFDVSTCWVIRHTYQVESVPGANLPPHSPIPGGRKIILSPRKYRTALAKQTPSNSHFRSVVNAPSSSLGTIIGRSRQAAVRRPALNSIGSSRRLSTARSRKVVRQAAPAKTATASAKVKKTSGAISAAAVAAATRRALALLRQKHLNAEAMDLDIYEKPHTVTRVGKARPTLGRYPIYFY